MNASSPSSSPFVLSEAFLRRFEVTDYRVGGHAIVMRALERNASKREVAIKTPNDTTRLTPERMTAFENESRLLQQIDDDNILRAYYYIPPGELDERGYLVTEWMDRSLASVLREERLHHRAALNILEAVLRGLRGLHGRGIVHRDLKPGNILISADGARVRIADLGSALQPAGDDPPSVLATPQYLAPDFYQNDNSPGIDVYAAGMIAYEMFLGAPRFAQVFAEVFAADSERSRGSRWMNWHQDLGCAAPDLHDLAPEVPAVIARVVMRMMAKDRQKRYASAAEVLADLASLGGPVTGAAAAPTAEPTAGAPPGSIPSARGRLSVLKRVLIGVCVALLLSILLVILIRDPFGAARERVEAARAEATTADLALDRPWPAFASAEQQRTAFLAAVDGDADADSTRALAEQAVAGYAAAVAEARVAAEAARERSTAARAAVETAAASGLEAARTAAMRASEGDEAYAGGRFGSAATAFEVAAETYDAALAEHGARARREAAEAARAASAARGAAAGDPYYDTGTERFTAGAKALDAADFVQATAAFDAAVAAFEQAGVADSAPVAFRAGSTEAELATALALCIPAGPSCTAERFAGEAAREVSLQPFRLDQHEVTNAEFAAFVANSGLVTEAEARRYSFTRLGTMLRLKDVSWKAPSGAGSNTAGQDELPVVHVSRRDAEAYCKAKDGRLPTEDEWEYAARGKDRRLFPWGDAWRPEAALGGAPDLELAAVGTRPDGATPDGLYELAGSVWEWTASTNGPNAVLKGGSFRATNPTEMRAAARLLLNPAQSYGDVGFRCAHDLETWLPAAVVRDADVAQ